MPKPSASVLGLSTEVPHLEPEAFLAAAPPGARGFWQRGGRWIAHAGVAGEVRAPPYGAAGDRFEAVRRSASVLLGSRDGAAEGGTRERPPRLYGGFAYDDGPPLAARFVLPELEIERGPRACTLRAWERVEPGGDASRAARRVGQRLREARARLSAARHRRSPPARPTSRLESPGLASWTASVARLLSRIEAGELEKAVLARSLELGFEEPLDPLQALARLRRRNPRAWPFFFELGPGVAVLGAAPELLLRLRCGRLRTMAVAGTAADGSARGADPGARLEESEKDRREQAIAVADIRERLAGWAEPLRIGPEPRLLRLSGVQHLRTDVRGRVPPGTHVLSALRRLHPTAAVCGRPREAARRALAGEEPRGRGWYAGPVGWFDARGDGLFVPALRSATLEGARLRLHAGAGIVRGSAAEDEWDETGLKLGTALEAFGIESDPRSGGAA